MPVVLAEPDMQELLRRFEIPLLQYATRITGDRERARDVVQETFIRLCRRWETEGSDANDPIHTEAWLFTVARNLSIDHQRKQSRIIYLPQAADRMADGPVPGAALEQQEERDSIFAMLDQLSENQRDVIRLKFQNDLSYKEIAEDRKSVV